VTVTRPERIKLVAVFAWLSGVTQVILGAVLLASAEPVGAVPWVAIATGLLLITAGFGLMRGGPISRLLATTAFGLAIAAAVWVLVSAPAYSTPAVISGVLAIAGVVVVWTHRVSSYFRAA
jgi:hypothetical protein